MPRKKPNPDGRPLLPQHDFPGAKQVIIKCTSCEMEYHVWLHLEHLWPKVCGYCKRGKMRRK